MDARYLTDSCTKWHPLSLCGCMRVEKLASAAFIKHSSKAPHSSNMPSNWPSLATLVSKCDKNCGSSIVALHLEGMVWIIFPPKSNLTCFLFVCCVLEDVCLNPHRALWLSPQEELNHSYENIKMQKHHTKTKKKREATFVCASKRNIEEQKSSVLFARFYIVCLITVYGCLGSNILDIQSCMRMQRFLVFSNVPYR